MKKHRSRKMERCFFYENYTLIGYENFSIMSGILIAYFIKKFCKMLKNRIF